MAEPKDIQDKFARLGFEAGTLARLCNRFQVFPRPDNTFILALGGAALADVPGTGEQWTHVEIATAVVFNREFAVDLATTLQFVGQFRPEELEQSKNRVLGAVQKSGS